MASTETRPTVLVVDDDPLLLESLSLHLKRQYDVCTARGGMEALKMLETREAAVVIADMRMPVMDGARLLSQVRERWPQTTRIMLTGDPGLGAAIAAVNHGQIFRYLTKPCAPEQLRQTVAAGVTEWQLRMAEQKLLEETLLGSIRALVDVLGITHPAAFGRAGRLKRLVADLASAAQFAADWQLESAAMFSQLGYVALPTELVQKVYDGEPLSAEEACFIDGVPQVVRRLLGHIPRLDGVLEILEAAKWPAERVAQLEPHRAAAAQVLAVALDYDSLICRGDAAETAVATLRGKEGRYHPPVVDALARLTGSAGEFPLVRDIALREVRIGMTFLNELRTEAGTLLVPAGYEVSPSFLERMTHFSQRLLAERVRVAVPGGKRLAAPNGRAH